MKITYRIIFISLVSLVFYGCTSANIRAIHSPNSDNASNIIIFRPDTLGAMLADMIVAVDGNEIAILQNKQYLSVLVEPGVHTISVRGTIGLTSEVDVRSKPLEIVYLEAAGSANNTFNFIPGLALVKTTFYIDHSEKVDVLEYTKVSVNYN